MNEAPVISSQPQQSRLIRVEQCRLANGVLHPQIDHISGFQSLLSRSPCVVDKPTPISLMPPLSFLTKSFTFSHSTAGSSSVAGTGALNATNSRALKAQFPHVDVKQLERVWSRYYYSGTASSWRNSETDRTGREWGGRDESQIVVEEAESGGGQILDLVPHGAGVLGYVLYATKKDRTSHNRSPPPASPSTAPPATATTAAVPTAELPSETTMEASSSSVCQALDTLDHRCFPTSVTEFIGEDSSSCEEGTTSSSNIIVLASCTYEGNFMYGARHGMGTLVVARQLSLSCMWRQDVPQLNTPLPTLFVEEGSLLVGSSSKWVYNGQLMVMVDGGAERDHFRGLKWALEVKLLPHGFGEQICVSHHRATAVSATGRAFGLPSLLKRNVTRYCGHWVHGRRHGFGVAMETNGDVFIGKYEKDHKSGSGVLCTNHSGATSTRSGSEQQQQQLMLSGRWNSQSGTLDLSSDTHSVVLSSSPPVALQGVVIEQERRPLRFTSATLVRSRSSVSGMWVFLLRELDDALGPAVDVLLSAASPSAKQEVLGNQGMNGKQSSGADAAIEAVTSLSEWKVALAKFQRCFFFLYGPACYAPASVTPSAEDLTGWENDNRSGSGEVEKEEETYKEVLQALWMIGSSSERGRDGCESWCQLAQLQHLGIDQGGDGASAASASCIHTADINSFGSTSGALSEVHLGSLHAAASVIPTGVQHAVESTTALVSSLRLRFVSVVAALPFDATVFGEEEHETAPPATTANSGSKTGMAVGHTTNQIRAGEVTIVRMCWDASYALVAPVLHHLANTLVAGNMANADSLLYRNDASAKYMPPETPCVSSASAGPVTLEGLWIAMEKLWDVSVDVGREMNGEELQGGNEEDAALCAQLAAVCTRPSLFYETTVENTEGNLLFTWGSRHTKNGMSASEEPAPLSLQNTARVVVALVYRAAARFPNSPRQRDRWLQSCVLGAARIAVDAVQAEEKHCHESHQVGSVFSLQLISHILRSASFNPLSPLIQLNAVIAASAGSLFNAAVVGSVTEGELRNATDCLVRAVISLAHGYVRRGETVAVPSNSGEVRSNPVARLCSLDELSTRARFFMSSCAGATAAAQLLLSQHGNECERARVLRAYSCLVSCSSTPSALSRPDGTFSRRRNLMVINAATVSALLVSMCSISTPTSQVPLPHAIWEMSCGDMEAHLREYWRSMEPCSAESKESNAESIKVLRAGFSASSHRYCTDLQVWTLRCLKEAFSSPFATRDGAARATRQSTSFTWKRFIYNFSMERQGQALFTPQSRNDTRQTQQQQEKEEEEESNAMQFDLYLSEEECWFGALLVKFLAELGVIVCITICLKYTDEDDDDEETRTGKKGEEVVISGGGGTDTTLSTSPFTTPVRPSLVRSPRRFVTLTPQQRQYSGIEGKEVSLSLNVTSDDFFRGIEWEVIENVCRQTSLLLAQARRAATQSGTTAELSGKSPQQY